MSQVVCTSGLVTSQVAVSSRVMGADLVGRTEICQQPSRDTDKAVGLIKWVSGRATIASGRDRQLKQPHNVPGSCEHSTSYGKRDSACTIADVEMGRLFCIIQRSE